MMGLHVIRDDITHVSADAIVNPTNQALRPGGGTDAAIHRAAGRELAEALRKTGTLSPGQAAITPGFALPCRFVIHTVGPRWFDGHRREREILSCCYQNSLRLAAEHGCKSVAVPLIASGSLGFPKDQALYIAAEEIRTFLQLHPMEVTLVVFDREAFRLSRDRFTDLETYIDEHYVESHFLPRFAFQEEARFEKASALPFDDAGFSAPCPAPMQSRPSFRRREKTLQERMAALDEGFSEMLLRKIDESGMTDAQCYKKAHIDRKLFSKIRSDPEYRPSKATVLSFVIALRLPMEDAVLMLQRAGFALSPSSKFDVILEYFIQSGNYDLFEINEALLAFDQPLLGV